MSFMNFCPNCFQSDSFDGWQCKLCGYQSQGMEEKRALQPGIWIRNRYLIGRILGVGGFGITYLAFDTHLRQRCAVKEYFPAEWAMRDSATACIMASSQIKDDLYRHGMEVFANEARVLQGLEREEHVVNVLDFFQENGTAYLVMEYLEGPTLGQYMEEYQNGYPLEMANRLICEIGDALYRIHKKMLLHRDISPDNVVLTGDNHLKLIDFGATRIYALNSPGSMSVLIKPGFAPIEQYSRQGKQGPWTDIYALAATYYYLASGKKPPTAPDRVAGAALRPLHTRNPQVPEQVSRAISHALENEWEKRPRNMKEFVREMGISPNAATQYAVAKIPYIWMQIPGARRTQQWEFINGQIRIGRSEAQCDVVVNNVQISGLHCTLQYEENTNRFLIKNFSGNGTYTKKMLLEKGAYTYLGPGEWFYLRTNTQQFLFYVEVR